MTGKSFQWPSAAVLVTAALFLLNALWIPLKAELAQVLLEIAWMRTVDGAAAARPWPWADTSPAGLLEVPGLGIRQIILAGASGRNLAFGPTALTDMRQADLVLSGHRDTHFSFLGQLREGELIRVETPGSVRDFEVSGFDVIDSRFSELVLEPGIDRLTLLTCYPLDAPTAGGPMRLLVTAEAIEAGTSRP